MVSYHWDVDRIRLKRYRSLPITVDRAYVFVMISVGMGVGGIIIGAYALSWKDERSADFGRK